MMLSSFSIPPVVSSLFYLIYILFIVFTVVKILLDTNSTPKTLAYILLVVVLPVVGLFFYYAFGINYRHKKITLKAADELKKFTLDYKKHVSDKTRELVNSNGKRLEKYTDLIHFIYQLGDEKLSVNQYKLLINGEEKFPEVLATLATAKHFIHMEYYAWENDIRGNQIKDLLLKKVKEGVKVRVLYDAYASRKIKNNIVKELSAGGAEICPVIKVKLTKLASHMNHRDHRKIIIVDGHTGFVGGINLSDRYDNSIDTGLWWRDTHVKITGETVHNLQRHFVINWNAAQSNALPYGKELFPDANLSVHEEEPEFAQVVAGGPIYPMSNIMLTYFKLFTTAKKKLYITNPYFIPNDSILDALKQAALSGVDVRLMFSEKPDSAVVGAASKFYYKELLHAGVRIFQYKKGFVHAKTVVADSELSIVGTANMDIRSFDLNFEIMPVIYGKRFARQLENAFLDDLKLCDEVNLDAWEKLSALKRLIFAVARLVSSFL